MAESPLLPLRPAASLLTDAARADPELAEQFVGLLPAAGIGSRMQPLRSPKELLPILYVESADGTGLQPVAAAEFALAGMYLAGVRHCYVIVSDAKPEIARYLGNGQERDMALAYLVQPSPRGLADAIDAGHHWLRDRRCCLALPDAMFSPLDALARVCREQIESGADLVLGVFPVANPGQLGPVRIDADGRVLEVQEKPAQTDLGNSWGVAAWSPVFTRFLHACLAADGTAAHPSVGSVFDAAVRAGLAVRAVMFEGGEYLDAGTPHGLRRLIRRAHPDVSPATPIESAAPLLLDRAAAALAGGDPEAAARAWDAAQSLRPDDGGLRVMRAVLAVQRGRAEAAVAIAHEGPLEHPDPALAETIPAATRADALVTLGDLLCARDSGRDAEAVWRLALAAQPRHAAAQERVARTAAAAGRLDEALTRAWQLVEQIPDAVAGQVLLGDLLEAAGQPAAAADAFRAALSRDPDCAPAHRALGRLAQQSGALEDAEIHLQRAFLLDPRDIETLRRLGWLIHDRGQLPRAETIARQAVKMLPDDPYARHLLGWLLYRQGREVEARGELERATVLPPALGVLGAMALAAGDAEAAESHLRRAVGLAPDDAGLQSTLAWALHDRRALGDAIDAAQRAVALAPDHPAYRAQLAWILIEDGKLESAAGQALRLAVADPGGAEPERLLGEIAWRQRRHADAERHFRAALERNPRCVPALGRLGALHQREGRLAEAESVLRTAVEEDPAAVEIGRELALLLSRQDRFDEAEPILRAGVDRQPRDAVGWLALGRLLLETGRDAESAVMLARAVAEDATLEAAWSLLARLAVRGVAAAESALDEAPEGRRRDAYATLIHDAIPRLSLDEYQRVVAAAQSAWPEDPLFESARLFGLVYDPRCDAEALRQEAQRFAGAVPQRPRPGRVPGRRPRVAYVGNYLHREFMAGYLPHHDHDRFEITLITDDALDKLGPRDPRLAVYRPKQAPIETICAALSIDLVIDVVGPYPRESLLKPHLALRRRVAPVQCLWINSFATTGSPAYDFLIADRGVIPAADERWYTERILALPHGQWFWTPPEQDIDPGPLPMLARRHVTLGSANRAMKLNDAVLNLWADVLLALPEARLRLAGWHTDDWATRRRVRGHLAARNIAAARVDFVAPADPDRMLVFYRTVDLTLDTFPFNGGLTTLESLWMGVPVIALAGQTFTGRQTESILRLLGHEDWVAPDRAGFVSRAVALASDPQRLAALRAGLRPAIAAAPMCDGPGFARDLEALFDHMLTSRP